jgi:hypothetical protein
MINLKELITIPKDSDGVEKCTYQWLIREITNVLTGAFKHIIVGYDNLIRAYLPGTATVNVSNDAAVSGW